MATEFQLPSTSLKEELHRAAGSSLFFFFVVAKRQRSSPEEGLVERMSQLSPGFARRRVRLKLTAMRGQLDTLLDHAGGLGPPGVEKTRQTVVLGREAIVLAQLDAVRTATRLAP